MFGTIIKQLRGITGLITVPGIIAMVLWLTAWPFLQIDQKFAFSDLRPYQGALAIDYDTATNVLGTIASASITTLSLVYSIVLVVFTLAAGNIAPRLLQRFTSDRVNQVTAGLLGGTYLFALTILHQTRVEFVPSLSIAAAFFLAAITVLQLIYFMHAVAKSVTIDEEVAEISKSLETRLSAIVANEDEQYEKPEDYDGPWVDVSTDVAGYLTAIETKYIVAAAAIEQTAVDIISKPGTFLLREQIFARFQSRDLTQEKIDALSDVIRKHCQFSPARDAEDDVEYSVNLLVEIALRALSPGVNDTYTAITCVDRISAAYQDIVKRGLRARAARDDEGHTRLTIEGTDVGDLINTAFNPIRRAASNNALMIQNLCDALVRLHKIAGPEIAPSLERQLCLTIEEFRRSDPLEDDIAFLEKRFHEILA